LLIDTGRTVLAGTAPFVETIDRSTPEGRLQALREIVRLGAEANLAVGTTSRSWATVIGVWALASGARVPVRPTRSTRPCGPATPPSRSGAWPPPRP
jgi:hypothetical protein